MTATGSGSGIWWTNSSSMAVSLGPMGRSMYRSATYAARVCPSADEGGVTILVDEAVWPWRGRRWAHLVSDASYDELHAFAARLGIPRRAFQGDHYDVPTQLRDEAIALGATPVNARELVRRLRAAG